MTPVLIPILNGRALTRNCIRSVLAQDVPTEVYVLDNGSTDGSAEMLRAWGDPRVHYIAAHKPSVAASWNFGLKMLFKEYDRVLVLNNDTEIRTDAVRLLDAHYDEFVTCVSRNDKACLTETLGPWNEREHPDFSAFLICRTLYETVGPFDEAFLGAYCEDSDYHVRIHQAGLRAVCIDVPFYHYGAGTLKQSDETKADAIRKQADANREYFKRKHGVEVGSPEYYALFAKGSPG